MPNQKTIVRTNSTPNSIKEVSLKALTFKELWDNYVLATLTMTRLDNSQISAQSA
jgi:hypothetical protein